MDYPKWKRVSEETTYKGRVHIVSHKAILPNGEETFYEVEHNEYGAASCLVKIGDDSVILSYQFRFPLNRWIYDLPGGGRMANETFEEAARRECREEVGIEPDTLIHLAEYYQNPGRSDWPVNLFFCTSHVEAQKIEDDPSEEVERRVLRITEVDELIEKGEIIDPALLIAWAAARRKGLI